MDKLLSAHIELVEKVNTLKGKDRTAAVHELHGFREALNIMGINQLIDCDMHYIDQGINVDMCGGVFLVYLGES